MSKKTPYYVSDVKTCTRAVEMPSGVLTDNTGCLFKKDRSHFFPAADVSCLNHFLLPTEKPCVLRPDVSVNSISGPWLCSSPQVYSQAQRRRTILLPKPTFTGSSGERNVSFTYLSKFLSVQKSISKLLSIPFLHFLQLLRHDTLSPYSQFCRFALRDI